MYISRIQKVDYISLIGMFLNLAAITGNPLCEHSMLKRLCQLVLPRSITHRPSSCYIKNSCKEYLFM